MISRGRKMLCPVIPMLPLLVFRRKNGLEILGRLNIIIVKESPLLEIKRQAKCFQIGKLISKNVRSKNSGSLLQDESGTAMANGTEMKMLNLTQMKMILTSASANSLRRHSGCSILIVDKPNLKLFLQCTKKAINPLKDCCTSNGVLSDSIEYHVYRFIDSIPDSQMLSLFYYLFFSSLLAWY